ncbi:death-associated inhibitor of apoptosis 1 [Monomorium pharaonis]|uniref:death-associated inhibitor of apoptosis 1 n=1 Tax=Monomorium pharaonis TaxID=307658 RepID=UPI00102E1791|nr:death-associated inhibitor of apoptosis 1 [Monomorium pharaonis]XP_036143268.1 death-associated inhibitor of apoptosis 1 [Monomorium pharaonis]XP_036143269.1 death-associated inhibitor of apoptosis 1 [Monomorium pharaonis]XP_036143270.1 death-associated inhibitor of apoptosis 1 [Monomorium pharaonis]
MTIEMTKCEFPTNSSHIQFKEPHEVYLEFRFESARLKSFKDWTLWMNPEILAAAGFYYTGDGDKVKCFDCLIELYKWQADDNPMVEHQRWSGRCRFVRNIPCGNVPISTNPKVNPAPVPKRVDVRRAYEDIYMPYSGPDYENQEIEEKVNHILRELASESKHPEYASYPARLASFDSWPKAMSQTTEKLVAAGFYYTGSSDETLCYHCGLGLKDWEPQDDPWVQHAKWFKYCRYLILAKGTKFINNITGRTYIGTENLSNVATIELDEKFKKVDEQSVRQGRKIMQNFCDKDAKLCKICCRRKIRTAFIPCGHLVACEQCAKNMKKCNVCRKPEPDDELTILEFILIIFVVLCVVLLIILKY